MQKILNLEYGKCVHKDVLLKVLPFLFIINGLDKSRGEDFDNGFPAVVYFLFTFVWLLFGASPLFFQNLQCASHSVYMTSENDLRCPFNFI